MYVLDTHVILWWCFSPELLSNVARRACTSIEREANGIVSSISLWEVGIKIKNHALDIGMSLTEFHRRLVSMGTLEIVPVDAAQWIQNLNLDWKHRDPTDRTIVALATGRSAELVTRDRTIRKFYKQAIW